MFCLTDVMTYVKSFNSQPLGGAIHLPVSVLGACLCVTSQLEIIMRTDIFGITLVYKSWALCLAEALSTSRGWEVFVNVGIIVV